MTIFCVAWVKEGKLNQTALEEMNYESATMKVIGHLLPKHERPGILTMDWIKAVADDSGVMVETSVVVMELTEEVKLTRQDIERAYCSSSGTWESNPIPDRAITFAEYIEKTLQAKLMQSLTLRTRPKEEAKPLKDSLKEQMKQLDKEVKEYYIDMLGASAQTNLFNSSST